MHNSIYGFSVTTIDGEEITLDAYQGKVLLIVNTASRCGFTGQYAGLQELQERFYDDGVRVLGFPSNDFMGQEPGTDEEIKEFCTLKYNVTFDMFSKINVKGKQQHALFEYLTTRPGFEGKVSWNFNKFLIDQNGGLVARFGTRTKPLSNEIIKKIEKLLQ
ncbi:glutathione peroxidase [Candidatus Omnitrophota bacterium]